AGDEMAQREAAGFPPYAHLALLRAESKHAEPPLAFLHAARRLLEPAPRARGSREPAAQAAALSLSGPMPAPMPKRAGMHRAQLLLLAPSRRGLHAALHAAVPAIH